MEFTWQSGRKLAGMQKSGTSTTYKYNSDGIRTEKVVNGVKTVYYIVDNAVVAESCSNGVNILYLFDESGTRIGMTYNGQNYYYLFNAQGDVTAIMNSSGAVEYRYVYDAWGKLVGIYNGSGQDVTNNTALTNVGYHNPIRYRGYYYDNETGFYYCSSRYYDPEVGRFVNADGYISTGNGVLETNMYAYCLNNPVNMFDPSGEIAITTLILIGSIVAGVAVSSYTAYTSHKYTGKVDWNSTILSGLSAFAFCYTYGMSAYGMYVNYCDYKGYTPVTNIGTSPKTNPTPYSNLPDPSNVAPGKDFTASQKAQIIQQNKLKNNGVVKSDLSGQILVPPQKSMKGVTPPANEWQIDHIIPKSAGGTNSFSNAQVLSREENRIKWDN